MKKIVKIIIAFIAITALAVAFIASAMAPIELELKVLAPETASITFTEQGTYTYEDTYTVYSLVSGEVLEVPVSKGQKVKKGEPLAVISARDYEYQIEMLNSGVNSYKSQISSLWEQEKREKDALIGERDSLLGQIASVEAQINGKKDIDKSIKRQISFQEDAVDSNRDIVSDMRAKLLEARYNDDEDAIRAAEIELAQAQQAFASSKVLLEQLQDGKIPEGFYEGQLQGLNSQLASINSRLNSSYSSGMTGYYNSLIEEAETNIRQMQEKQGQATTVSPADGVIIELNVRDSNIINQQSPVGTIGWNEYIEVYVATRELDSIKIGDKVELKLYKRQGDEISTGTISKIEEMAEVRNSALGVEESKIKVLVKPDKKELVIGEHVDVIFSVFKQDEALIVPKTAIFTLDGNDMVWVVRNGAAYRQEIEKGTETRNGYIINSGLSAGDNVIKDANIQGLDDGKRVAAT